MSFFFFSQIDMFYRKTSLNTSQCTILFTHLCSFSKRENCRLLLVVWPQLFLTCTLLSSSLLIWQWQPLEKPWVALQWLPLLRTCRAANSREFLSATGSQGLLQTTPSPHPVWHQMESVSCFQLKSAPSVVMKDSCSRQLFQLWWLSPLPM